MASFCKKRCIQHTIARKYEGKSHIAVNKSVLKAKVCLTFRDSSQLPTVHHYSTQTSLYTEQSDKPEGESVSDLSSRMYGISSILRNTESLGLFWPSDLLPVAHTDTQLQFKSLCVSITGQTLSLCMLTGSGITLLLCCYTYAPNPLKKTSPSLSLALTFPFYYWLKKSRFIRQICASTDKVLGPLYNIMMCYLDSALTYSVHPVSVVAFFKIYFWTLWKVIKL